MGFGAKLGTVTTQQLLGTRGEKVFGKNCIRWHEHLITLASSVVSDLKQFIAWCCSYRLMNVHINQSFASLRFAQSSQVWGASELWLSVCFPLSFWAKTWISVLPWCGVKLLGRCVKCRQTLLCDFSSKCWRSFLGFCMSVSQISSNDPSFSFCFLFALIPHALSCCGIYKIDILNGDGCYQPGLTNTTILTWFNCVTSVSWHLKEIIIPQLQTTDISTVTY